MGKASRTKGARGELEVCKILRAAGFNVERTPNSGGLRLPTIEFSMKGDVVGLAGYHLEVKRCERLSIPAWIKQAEADCPEGDVPIVVFRASQQPWRVIQSFESFVEGIKP